MTSSALLLVERMGEDWPLTSETASRMPACPQADTAANKWLKDVTLSTRIDGVIIRSEFVTVP